MDRLARARAQADEIAGRRSGDPEVAELARCVVTLCDVIAAIQGRTGVELVRAERENKREDAGAAAAVIGDVEEAHQYPGQLGG